MSWPRRNRSHQGRPNRADLLGLDPEQVEAARLAELIAAADVGGRPDIDPAEDPALASLLGTASAISEAYAGTTESASFDRFHKRSRHHVLAATPQKQARLARTVGNSWLQRWNGLFTSVASAAAASVATLVVAILALTSSSGSPVAVQSLEPTVEPDGAQVAAVPASSDVTDEPAETRLNLTSLSISDQMSTYVALLNRLDTLTASGRPADEQLLRDLADAAATVQRTIEKNPDALTGGEAFTAYRLAYDGRQTISEATVADEADEPVLFTARAAADAASESAYQYLQDPARVPTAQDAEAAEARVYAARVNPSDLGDAYDGLIPEPTPDQ